MRTVFCWLPCGWLQSNARGGDIRSPAGMAMWIIIFPALRWSPKTPRPIIQKIWYCWMASVPATANLFYPVLNSAPTLRYQKEERSTFVHNHYSRFTRITHPLLARVLECDPNGTIVLFAGRHPYITKDLFNLFTQLLRDRGIDPKNRGVILPSVAHDDYLAINMLCDVMLDTLHWSGGNTSLDAIACNLPLVTLPGEFMRGRRKLRHVETHGAG